jgi:histidyl-tRNA synthetase
MPVVRKKPTPAAKPAAGKPSGLPGTPKGMHDIVPVEQSYWERVRAVAARTAEYYHFNRIDTPIVEFAQLFEKGTGQGTDIVQKEMYTFRMKAGELLALRPEFTPGVARAYVQNALSRQGQPQRLFSLGPIFRHDKPQLGRERQFHQLNFECLGGTTDPIYDAQIIVLALRLLEDLKLKNIVLSVNSIGCRICRPAYKRQLQTYYRAHERDLCKDCVRRLKDNPLRLLDCKEKKCVELREHAPNILDKLCATCNTHFKSVIEYLEEVGIVYTLQPYLVRGLDYYNRTVFEFGIEGHAELGSLGGGGRYDYLLETLGARPAPAVGMALGMERIILAMKAQEVKLPLPATKTVFVAHAGSLAKKKALQLIELMRAGGVPTRESLARESLKAQLKVADKEGMQLALIIGQKEVYEQSAIIRDFRTGLQETFPLARIVDEVKKRLKEL